MPEPATSDLLPVIPFDERTRHVLELRELVRRGAYRPDPREIARALLAHALACPAPEEDGSLPEFDPARFIVRPAAPAADAAARRAVS
ncbi:MAG: flagellar biosynthesis anti-sigma factor FlgM [Dehalococcoidia bacterium]|nr:flagellar biosynthesis anti-sigma factor FlgM [Dehalococcoidia bacterium]